MPITKDELYANYSMWILTYIYHNSTPRITNFIETMKRISIIMDDGKYKIKTWDIKSPDKPPTDEELMKYNSDDYKLIQRTYVLQLDHMPIPSVTNEELAVIASNTDGIRIGTLLLNTTDNTVIMKTSLDTWSVIWKGIPHQERIFLIKDNKK